MKRILSVIMIVSILLFSTVPCYAQVEISAESAILIEKETGKVLYEKNPDKKLPPASVTKVMTLLIIMEEIEAGRISYDTTVTASAYATSMGGSQVYLKEGETMTVHEMLKCIVISSANDACVAMAEFISGSVEAFVLKMNERAKQLGMANTHFVNCTGLDADGHLTTARDISVMSKELLKHPDIKKYTTIWMDSIRNGEFGLTNTNKLIRFYKYATGLKTGYTQKSKYCISATAEKDGMELIAVIMAAPSSQQRNDDARALFEYAFSKYTLYSPNIENLSEIKILKGKQKEFTPVLKDNITMLVEKGNEQNIKVNVSLVKDVAAPVENGQKVGEVTISNSDEIIGTLDIISPKKYEKATVFDFYLNLLEYFLIV